MDENKTAKVIQMIKNGARVYQYYLRGAIEVILDEEREYIDNPFFSDSLRASGMIEKVKRIDTCRDYDKCDVYKFAEAAEKQCETGETK